MAHSKQRYLFIDLLRFIAVFFMIQGHVFDALLEWEAKSHSLYFIHDFFHGFIAPMFLFASGVAFGISTFKKWEDHIVYGSQVRRRIGKFLGLIAIGYALHLPYFSFHKIIEESTPQEINAWLQVDALHCIAITLLVLQLLVLVLKTEKRFVLVTAAAAVTILFLSPIIWTVQLRQFFPVWLVSYFNVENNSWFPVFPWSAYILSGVVFASLFINAKEHHHAVALMQKVIPVSTGVIILAVIVAMIPLNLYPPHDFWKVNPSVILARIAFVLIIAGSVFFAEHSFTIRSRIPQIMGRQSLFIYVVHLLIIYGSVVNNGLNFYIGPVLSIVQALGIFVLIFLLITVITVSWYELTVRYKLAATVLRAGVAGIFLYQFFTRPW